MFVMLIVAIGAGAAGTYAHGRFTEVSKDAAARPSEMCARGVHYDNWGSCVPWVTVSARTPFGDASAKYWFYGAGSAGVLALAFAFTAHMTRPRV